MQSFCTSSVAVRLLRTACKYSFVGSGAVIASIHSGPIPALDVRAFFKKKEKSDDGLRLRSTC